MIHIEQLSSSHEELKRKLFQNSGLAKGDNSKYEEKINILSQSLRENDKRIEELLDENEGLKRKLNSEISSKARLEEDRKQINSYLEQIKMEAQLLILCFKF